VQGCVWPSKIWRASYSCRCAWRQHSEPFRVEIPGNCCVVHRPRSLENRRCCGIPYCEADYEVRTRHHRRNLRFVGAPGPCPLLPPSHSCNHYSRPTSRRTCASFTPSSAVPSRSLVQATPRVTAGAWRCVFLPPFSPHLTSLKPAGPSHLAAIAQM
jgi:hypothetical protein